jgi:hypothetical protein
LARSLRAGAEEIEVRLRGVAEPSVEKLKEALREEIRVLEERFLTRNLGSKEEEMAESQVPMKSGTRKKPADDVPGNWSDFDR